MLHCIHCWEGYSKSYHRSIEGKTISKAVIERRVKTWHRLEQRILITSRLSLIKVVHFRIPYKVTGVCKLCRVGTMIQVEIILSPLKKHCKKVDWVENLLLKSIYSLCPWAISNCNFHYKTEN